MTTSTSDLGFDAALAQVHERWISIVARMLAPATIARAGFWERWAAVRFLSDQFRNVYRLERALLEQLAPKLDPAVLADLRAGLGRIEHLRQEADTAGRRRGTAPVVAGLALQLLLEVQRWSRAFDQAAASVAPGEVPGEGRELVERIATASDLGGLFSAR